MLLLRYNMAESGKSAQPPRFGAMSYVYLYATKFIIPSFSPETTPFAMFVKIYQFARCYPVENVDLRIIIHPVFAFYKENITFFPLFYPLLLHF